MPQRLVMKFGGTSVSSKMAIDNIRSIIKDAQTAWHEIVIVASALSGVTNSLLEAVNAGGNSDLAAESLRSRHFSLLQEVVADQNDRAAAEAEIEDLIEEFLKLSKAMDVLGDGSPKSLDAVVSLGERMSVVLLAAGLNAHGFKSQPVSAASLIVTDDRYQNASPDLAATKLQAARVLRPLFEEGIIPVATGFIGAAPNGHVTTLGRGGSDYSATILGNALEAGEVWIWTDVDGIMTADPRIAADAKTLPTLSYREAAELAYFGAKVLHPKAIRPVVDENIPVRVCNTFNPSHPGTVLTANQHVSKSQTVKAVTVIRDQCLVTIEGRGMLGVPGVAARAFSAVANLDTSVTLISQASSEQSICFSVPKESTAYVIEALQKTFQGELKSRDIDSIWSLEDIVIITAVGAGMRNTPGIAGKIFSALGDLGINVIAIAQGSSEVSISLVTSDEDKDATVRAIHGLIVADH